MPLRTGHRVDANRQRFSPPVRLERWRAWFALGSLLLLFTVLLGRGLWLQAFNEAFLQEQGEARYARNLKLEANRGMITDRNGEPLAISTPVQSIWASPRSVTLLPEGQERHPEWEPASEKDPTPVSRAEVARLAKALGMTPADLAKRLSETRKNARGEEQKADFVWLRRHMAPIEAKAVLELNMPGVYAQTEYRRYYPAGEIMAHIVGFTDIDGKGQEGFELTRESMLAGKPGSRSVIRDRRGYIVEDVSTIVPPRDGARLELSIDRRIQYLAYRELNHMVESTKAIGGGVVVLDARTGEVLALANSPSYNPNSRARIDPARRRNRALTDVYEPGSTMKPFTVAAAMEAGKIRPSTMFATDGGRLRIGPNTISDAHVPASMLNVEQIVQKSSNVGTAKIALMLDREYFWGFLRDVGYGEPLRTGFPGEVSGRLRPWKNWVPIDQATISYGHGVSVNLMQMARAYQLFATNGEVRPVTFTRLVAPLPGKKVISVETARAVRKMLEMVTQPGGTAQRAQVVGYRVAGKTGTSTKLENGQYVKKYVASFVGFAPVSDPRLIVAVMIDEPVGGYYGGQVAAPIFSNVVAGSLRMLGVPPDAPTGNTIGPDSDVEDVREET